MKLHMPQSLQVQWKIEKVVQVIGDTKVLVMFIASDVSAIQGKYHWNCVLAYKQWTTNQWHTRERWNNQW